MNVYCIIPARGGSKGIPGKNLRSVAGKPLLAWSIEQAGQAPQISRVFISTDSVEIANVARQYGAEVIMRPPEISGDTASSESCLLHALDYLRTAASQPSALNFQLSGDPDLVVFLQATSPLREADDIQKALETLEREQADSLFSACRVEGFVWRVEGDARVRSFSYDHQDRPRRQDAPEDLVENGSIYIFKPWVLRKFNNRLGGKIAVYRMPALNSFQIDEPADLELVEHLMAYRARSLSASDSSPLRLDRGEGQGEVSLNPGFNPQLSTLNSQLASIRLLALDFDGVLTDNCVLVSEDGKESVLCDRGDGLGIAMLKQAGIEILVLSKEKNPVVAARCRKLGIECIQGCDNKLAALQRLASDPSSVLRPPSSGNAVSAFQPEEIAYVGNDVNDLECLHWVGLPIAVADAVPEILAAAKYITKQRGGHGAVREVCDLLLVSKGPCP